MPASGKNNGHGGFTFTVLSRRATPARSAEPSALREHSQRVGTMRSVYFRDPNGYLVEVSEYVNEIPAISKQNRRHGERH